MEQPSKPVLLVLLVSLLANTSLVTSLLELGDPCEDKRNDFSGTCIPLVDCDEAKEQLKKGGLPYTCGFEPATNKPIVCCPSQDKATDSIDPWTIFSSKDNAATMCQKYSSQLFNNIDLSPKKQIVGGKNASLGDIPHMVGLGFDTGNGGISWKCGGSLISEYYVLTVAHCLSSDTGQLVSFARVGVVNIDEDKDYRQDFRIVERIRHPSYEPPQKYHDIALLKLDKPVRFNTFVKPVCLDQTRDPVEFGGVEVQVSGWGVLSFGGSTSRVLQTANLRYFTRESCNQSYSTTSMRNLKRGIDPEIQICFGSDKMVDSCTGDSGGPLDKMIWDKRLHNLIGLVSFGKICATPGIPGIYTRVAYYIPWIEGIVWGRGADGVS